MQTKPFDAQLETEFLTFIEQKLQGSLHAYPTIRGMLFAISAAPEIPMPNVWLPWVFKGAPQELAESTVNQLVEYLISAFQHQSRLTRDEVFVVDTQFAFQEDIEQSKSFALFCYGWLIAHMHLEKTWTQAFDQMEQQKDSLGQQVIDHLSDILGTLSSFAEYIDKGVTETDVDYLQLANKLPQLMGQYVSSANVLLAYVPDQFESFHQPVKREGDKIGRNDPCPCDSGKKYKKCCGR